MAAEPGHLQVATADASGKTARRRSVDPTVIRVIVVEEDVDQRNDIVSSLTDAGYSNVREASSIDTAMKVLNKEPGPTLVMIDVDLATDNENLFLNLIRGSSTTREIPLIMMSASKDLSNAIRCLELGADDYILKPVRKDYVLNLWSNVWRRRNEARQLRQIEDQHSQMTVQMNRLATSVENLKTQVSEAVETPIHVITRTIKTLVDNNTLTEEVRQALTSIVTQFASYNLYKPSFDRLFSSEETRSILSLSLPPPPTTTTTTTTTTLVDESATSSSDHEAREWIRSELSMPNGRDHGGQRDEVGLSWKQLMCDVASEDKLKLRSWDFNVWHYSEDDLIRLFATFFDDFDLFAQFGIERETLSHFLVAVHECYPRSNPYHNFRHAWDVTQASYLMITRCKASEYLTSLEILALIVASIAHDIGHTATSNIFLVNIRHPLALLYNDLSPLENHHCAELFRILQRDDCNLLKNLSAEQHRQVRRSIIACIIATDLPRYHVEIVTKFENCTPSFSKDNPEHRQLLLEVLLKAADISNPCRPFHISKYWAYMVVDEFFAQGDREKELSIPLSPCHDRHTIAVPKTQMSFISFVVKPFFASLSVLLPELSELLAVLDQNHVKWQAIQESSEQAPSDVLPPRTHANPDARLSSPTSSPSSFPE